jgi:hypothetical protein
LPVVGALRAPQSSHDRGLPQHAKEAMADHYRISSCPWFQPSLVYCLGKREADWPCHHSGTLAIDEVLCDIERR